MKKDLEHIYKQALEEFTETPDERVWEAISASLDKKDKRRVVPFWWYFGGAAAVLAILFFSLYPSNPASLDTVPITQTETEVLENETKTEVFSKETPVVTNSDKNSSSTQITRDTDENTYTSSTQQANSAAENKAIVNSNADYVTRPSTNSKSSYAASSQITSNEKTETTDVETPKNQKFGNPSTTEPTAIAEVTPEEIVEEKESAKKSIFEAIEEKEDDEVAENDNPSKWAIGPSIAPVYFDAIGQGSPIDANFVTNTKTGDVNFSYGVAVTYAVAPKLKVRSGVHRVDLSYRTNQIIFSAALGSPTQPLIDNIDFSEASQNLVVQSANEATNVVSDIIAPIAALNGRIVQEFGYLEVPVEFNYAVMDKRLGINLIGGLSSLFLVNNAISLESGGLAAEVGKANNLNAVNFSTNVGVGLNYELLPKIRLNVEPLFKYQLNTFSNTSGNFRPFSLGVYSGVNYRF